ncbi:rRNA maturation RNase YbeY [Patescibacteria group bacterium]|nr:MAG: rRNA maturation RNase YbeY [Patescibacteria group bacterium]
MAEMAEEKNSDRFAVTNITKGKLPRLPFALLKERLLGVRYELSLVFSGSNLSRKLNRRYRGRNQPANVLSFSLGPASGEIFIDLPRARREALASSTPLSLYLGGLFIHGMLHLKGRRHGSRMEREEIKFLKKFNLL